MDKQSTVFVTGGAGFIGSALVRRLIEQSSYRVVNIDKLTYAGNLASLHSVESDPRYVFEQVDICDGAAIKALFQQYQPCAIVHLAAESHVDRSIDGPAEFLETNVIGTFRLLEAAVQFIDTLSPELRSAFRFLHVSTDEVFGDLDDAGYFTEHTAYRPSSPYSASKASSDHLVRAWYRTYGLPVLISNCSNNYGPYQYPEKLIPRVILNALDGRPIPIYGDGCQVRDWLFVEDHVQALLAVLDSGQVGETYNIGGCNEKTNLQVVSGICSLLDELMPDSPQRPFSELIEYVADRPGHDRRYAIDAGKIMNELGWHPDVSFEQGLRKTVRWYLDHLDWCRSVQADVYDGQRLGLRVVEP